MSQYGTGVEWWVGPIHPLSLEEGIQGIVSRQWALQLISIVSLFFIALQTKDNHPSNGRGAIIWQSELMSTTA